MFRVVSLDNATFVIVKAENGSDGQLPKECPFETYGFIYKQQGCGNVMFTLLTQSKEVEAEQQALFEQAMKTQPLFRTI